jgi:hypothetical protein
MYSIAPHTKKTWVVDVVIVNSVMGLMGWGGVKGVRIKGGGEVANREGTRVDRDPPP